MSGSLRVLPPETPAGKHDHFDLLLGDRMLRLRDPRRFGAVLWAAGDIAAHPLLAHLGVEPLSRALTPARLHALTRGHRTAIKHFLMDGRRVVGVGNIYASESLFRARHQSAHARQEKSPSNKAKSSSRRSRTRCTPRSARAAPRCAISSAPTARRDMRSSATASTTAPGRIAAAAATPIRKLVQGQRSTYFCPTCQK